MIVSIVPIRIESEANRRDHWAVKHRRARAQRFATMAALRLAGAPPPVPPTGPEDEMLARDIAGCDECLNRNVRVTDEPCRSCDGQDRWTSPGPLSVKLVRIAPRKLDTDNLANGFKAVRDEVALWLGVDDGPNGPVQWSYEQERGKDYAVRIEVDNG